jgi:hypothetical protein
MIDIIINKDNDKDDRDNDTDFSSSRRKWEDNVTVNLNCAVYCINLAQNITQSWDF